MNKYPLISLVPLLLGLCSVNANPVTSIMKAPESVIMTDSYYEEEETPVDNELKNTFQVRVDAFFPASDRFRHIYGTVAPSYEVEASRKLNSFIDIWANFDWFFKHGEAGCHTSTEITVANGSFGIKFPFKISKHVKVYVGLGPTFAGVWLENKTHCDHKHISKFSFGGIAKSGFIFSLNKHVFFDLFADYFYQPVHYKKHVNVGGLRTGLGLGYKY